MKQFVISVALAIMALLPLGCTTKQEGGVPGTANSFTLKADKSVSLHQGEKKQVEVTLDRHKEFKQGIDLTVTPSADAKGITATVDPKSVKTTDSEKTKATVTIEAAGDAAPAESTVTVKATPNGEGTSAPSSVDIKVKVSAKK